MILPFFWRIYFVMISLICLDLFFMFGLFFYIFITYYLFLYITYIIYFHINHKSHKKKVPTLAIPLTITLTVAIKLFFLKLVFV